MKRPSEPTVGVAELKAHLSEHLRRVRRGRAVTVVDRRTPVARLVPVPEPRPTLVLRAARRRFADFRPSAPPARPTDSLAVLRELRRERL